MPQYTNFAYIYDELMQDIPYQEWVEYINKLIKEYQLTPQRVLDLGCGTGNVSIPLAQAGYQITAVDLSTDMLNVAYEKALKAGVQLQFVNQDITELEVPGQYELVLSMCDTLNYLPSKAELEGVIKKVYSLLPENGLFIFDLNTHYKIAQVFGDETYTHNQEDIAYIWENFYNEEEEKVTMDITFFTKRADGSYQRFVETHQETGFHHQEVLDLLVSLGFKSIKAYEELTFNSPTETTERIYYVVQK